MRANRGLQAFPAHSASSPVQVRGAAEPEIARTRRIRKKQPFCGLDLRILHLCVVIPAAAAKYMSSAAGGQPLRGGGPLLDVGGHIENTERTDIPRVAPCRACTSIAVSGLLETWLIGRSGIAPRIDAAIAASSCEF